MGGERGYAQGEALAPQIATGKRLGEREGVENFLLGERRLVGGRRSR
jgi:hypothetical protein